MTTGAGAATGDGAVAINGAAARVKVLMQFRLLIRKWCIPQVAAASVATAMAAPTGAAMMD